MNLILYILYNFGKFTSNERQIALMPFSIQYHTDASFMYNTIMFRVDSNWMKRHKMSSLSYVYIKRIWVDVSLLSKSPCQYKLWTNNWNASLDGTLTCCSVFLTWYHHSLITVRLRHGSKVLKVGQRNNKLEINWQPGYQPLWQPHMLLCLPRTISL